MSKKIEVWKQNGLNREQSGGSNNSRRGPMTPEERLYFTNFEDLRKLREQVYTKLNWWPRDVFLPEQIKKSKSRSPQGHKESFMSQNGKREISSTQEATHNGAIASHPPGSKSTNRLEDSGSSRNSSVRFNGSQNSENMSSDTSDHRRNVSQMSEDSIGRFMNSSGVDANGNHPTQSNMSWESSGSQPQGTSSHDERRLLENFGIRLNGSIMSQTNTPSGISRSRSLYPRLQNSNGLSENSRVGLNENNESARSSNNQRLTEENRNVEIITNCAQVQEENRFSEDFGPMPNFDDLLVGSNVALGTTNQPADPNKSAQEEESESYGSISFESSFHWSSQ